MRRIRFVADPRSFADAMLAVAGPAASAITARCAAAVDPIIA